MARKSLQKTIEENIRWFWDEDPIIYTSIDLDVLWSAFKVWCMRNCIEVHYLTPVPTILSAIDSNYSKWIMGKTRK